MRKTIDDSTGIDADWWLSVDGASVRLVGEAEAANQAAAQGSGDRAAIWRPPLPSWVPATHFDWIRDRLFGGPPKVPANVPLDDPLRQLALAISYPIRHPSAWKSVLPLSFIQWVPILGAIVGRGWRMAFLQKPPDEPYPAFRLVNLLATGLNLWIVYLLYLSPELVFALREYIDSILDFFTILGWLRDVVATGAPPSGTGSIIINALIDFILNSGFLLFMTLITWPLHRIGMMRFAREHRWRAFVELGTNIRIMRAHYPVLLNLFLQSKGLWVLVIVISPIAALTIIGAWLLFPTRLIASAAMHADAMATIFKLDSPTVTATRGPDP